MSIQTAILLILRVIALLSMSVSVWSRDILLSLCIEHNENYRLSNNRLNIKYLETKQCTLIMTMRPLLKWRLYMHVRKFIMKKLKWNKSGATL